jgi:hypothetical protein
MGHQIQWVNPPPKGTKVLHGRKIETVDEIGMAGMIYHTDKRGFQSASFPSDLKLPPNR